MILSEFSKKPNPHVWTEQDLTQQVRKMINEYNAKSPPEELHFSCHFSKQ